MRRLCLPAVLALLAATPVLAQPVAPANPDTIADQGPAPRAPTATASNISAEVKDSPADLTGRGDKVLGRILSVTRDREGRIRNALVETSDGVRRILPGSQFSYDGNVATTPRTDAQLRSLRRAE